MELLRRTRFTIATLLLAACVSSFAATGAPNEYALKSVFLYNFCRFIELSGGGLQIGNDSAIGGLLLSAKPRGERQFHLADAPVLARSIHQICLRWS